MYMLIIHHMCHHEQPVCSPPKRNSGGVVPRARPVPAGLFKHNLFPCLGHKLLVLEPRFVVGASNVPREQIYAFLDVLYRRYSVHGIARGTCKFYSPSGQQKDTTLSRVVFLRVCEC